MGERKEERMKSYRGKSNKNVNVKIGTGTLISASRAFFIVFPVMRQAGLKALSQFV